MATTNLIVDYLVIGVASSLWIIPLLLFTLGDKWLPIFSSSSIVTGFGLLGFFYLTGIAISRLADDIFDRWNEKWCDEVFGSKADPSYHNRLNYIIAKSASASDYLSYRRSIIRISRSCSVNFIIGTFGWLLLALFKPTPLFDGSEFFISIISILIAVLLARALPVVSKGYFYSIKDIHKYLSEKEKN